MSAADVFWFGAYVLGAIGMGFLIHELWTAWGATSQSEDWHP